jgi:hypothetical protein
MTKRASRTLRKAQSDWHPGESGSAEVRVCLGVGTAVARFMLARAQVAERLESQSQCLDRLDRACVAADDELDELGMVGELLAMGGECSPASDGFAQRA